MKKIVVIEILLLFVFAVLIACTTKLFIYITELNEEMIKYGIDTQAFGYQIYKGRLNTATSYAIPTLIASIADLVVIVIIAIKDFTVFKPIAVKFNAHKEKRAEARAEKVEIAKQQRIEKLQAELNELKKDE